MKSTKYPWQSTTNFTAFAFPYPPLFEPVFVRLTNGQSVVAVFNGSGWDMPLP